MLKWMWIVSLVKVLLSTNMMNYCLKKHCKFRKIEAI